MADGLLRRVVAPRFHEFTYHERPMFFADDTKPSFFVVDRDAAQLSAEIRDLRRELEAPTFSFDGVRWEVLASSLSDEGGAAVPQQPGLVLATPVLPQLFIDEAPARPLNFQAFMERGGEAIRTRGDDRLGKALDDLARMVESATERERAAADYYARFLPGVTQDADVVPVLRRLLQSVLDTLRTLLKGSRGIAEGLWTVLRDHDGAYLRYRGEIEEYARANGTGELVGWLTFLPDFFRLYVRLLLDDRVSRAVKRRVMAALAYLVLPVDLIPDGVPAMGLADDTLVLACTLLELVDEHAVARELLQDHWVGSPGQLDQALTAARFLRVKVPLFREIYAAYQSMVERP